MQKQPSFREIFIAHLSQNSPRSEAMFINFDHTMYETPYVNHQVFRQTSSFTSKSYRLEKDRFPQMERPPETPAPSSQKVSTKAPPKEFHLTMKHLKTAEQLAAASIVTGYQNEERFFPRTEKELKSSYRKMISTEHPDRGGNPHIFIELLEAYRILLDAIKIAQQPSTS